MVRINVEGAYDVHTHPAPCLFPRLLDDRGLAQAVSDYKMAGFMIKSHHESSVTRAALVDAEYEDIKVFGGIVLNTFVGGLNPLAVEMALRHGGRAVWFPTCDSKKHIEIHGAPGRYSDAQDQKSKFSHSGITLSENGKLKQDVLDIMDLAKENDVFLGSGHCTVADCHLLADRARETGFKKLVMQHVHYKIPNLDISNQKELAAKGAVIEFGYCTIAPAWAANTLVNAAKAINEVGAKHCILVSDACQLNNPAPPECMRLFAQGLSEIGVSEKDLMTMIIENPKWLLGEA